MKNDAAWLRAMGKVALRMSEEPDRKRIDEIHTGLRALAFECQALALQIEDADELVAEEPTQPGAG